jgi:hypothetical protein
MIILNNKKSFILVFILLFFSGNPLAFFLFGKYSSLIGLLFTLSILNFNFKIDSVFLKKLKLYLLTICIIALLQFLTFNFFSTLAFGNLILKILMGGLIINYLKDSFSYVFFRVIAILSLLSLIGFLIINKFGLDFPFVKTGLYYKSYIFYGSLSGEALSRNCGMFWEPGAFAGILTLSLTLIFKNLKYIWIHHKYFLFVIFLSILTTQSTTGYIVCFFIILFYFINLKNIIQSLILLFTFIFISFYIFNKSDFLKNKVENQLVKAKSQRVGNFSNTRFGSLIFDWHYISKHPITGNGFNFKTRYADHQFLFRGATDNSDVIGSGNGFSGFLASMGILFISFYFILLWKTSNFLGNKFAFFICLIVFLNLQGEQFFNYPLYLSLPFLNFKKITTNNLNL